MTCLNEILGKGTTWMRACGITSHFLFRMAKEQSASARPRGARPRCMLSEHTLSGAPLYYEDRSTGYYYVVFKEYLAFYRLEGERILIDRVLFGRSDYIRILKSGTDH